MTSLKSQNERIKAALLGGEKITPITALERFGTVRLAARIFEVKQEGLDITKETIPVGADRYVARYFLKADNREQLEMDL